jgi:hypothetical protein
MPCINGNAPWEPDAKAIQTLGLSPQDAAALKAAYAKSAQQVWDVLKPLCVAVVGSGEVADKIGADNCSSLILDSDKSAGKDTHGEAVKAVAEMRAGMRPMPGPNDPVNPATKVLLTVSGSEKVFEDSLAQSVGPEEAHRLAYSDELCMSRSVHRTQPKKGHAPGSMATDNADDAMKH